MRLKQAYPTPNNTSIVIYYSDKGEQFRFPTGISISNKKKAGKFIEWDYKQNMLRPYVDDFETKKTTILELAKRVNEILSEHFNAGQFITPTELKHILVTKQAIRSQSINSLLRSQYEEFLELKRKGFEAKGKMVSLKDFTSTKHLLEAYELVKNKRLKIGALGEKSVLHDLLNFMRVRQPNKVGETGLKFRGELNEKTAKKRFDILVQFGEYLKELKLVDTAVVEKIKKFRKVEIKVIQGVKETLTIPEVHQLYNHQFDNERLEQIKDVFVFLCFTGIRFQDLVDFDTRFINDNVYIKRASKTSLNYNIPMSDIVLEILAKYHGRLPVISNTKSNLYLKEALAKTGIFNGVTQIVDKETGKYKLRYEVITMHKGRDTFITNLIDTTPLNELMKYTGHQKLSTLQIYLDRRRPVSKDFIKKFNQ